MSKTKAFYLKPDTSIIKIQQVSTILTTSGKNPKETMNIYHEGPDEMLSKKHFDLWEEEEEAD